MLSASESFYKRLTQGDAESASIENQILHARTSAFENSEAISIQLTGSESKLKELDRVY
jgi:hypothetical protein